MADLLQVYDEETLDAFPEGVLRECETVATLALEGYIPSERLPGLWTVMGKEKSLLVMEAMEGRDAP